MSNCAILEVCPNNGYWASNLLVDDVLLRTSDPSQTLALCTTSNVAPAISINGTTVKINGINIQDDALSQSMLIDTLLSRRYSTYSTVLEAKLPSMFVDNARSNTTNLLSLGSAGYASDVFDVAYASGLGTYRASGSQVSAPPTWMTPSNWSTKGATTYSQSQTCCVNSNFFVTGPAWMTSISIPVGVLGKWYGLSLMRQNASNNFTCMVSGSNLVNTYNKDSNSTLVMNYVVPGDGLRYYPAFHLNNNNTGTIFRDATLTSSNWNVIVGLVGPLVNSNYPAWSNGGAFYAPNMPLSCVYQQFTSLSNDGPRFSVTLSNSVVTPSNAGILHVAGLVYSSDSNSYSDSNACAVTVTADGGSNWQQLPLSTLGSVEPANAIVYGSAVMSNPGSSINAVFSLSNVSMSGLAMRWQ